MAADLTVDALHPPARDAAPVTEGGERLLAHPATRRLIVGWTLAYALGAWLLESAATAGRFGPATKSIVYALAWGPILLIAVLLTDRWPVRGVADVARLALHGVAALTVPFLWGTATYYACVAWVPGWQPWGVGRMYLNTAVSVLFGYSAIVVVCHLALHVRRGQLREAAHLRAAETAARAQLEVLSIQLQPHFLFNALNAVSSLLDTDRAAATAAMRGIRDLLAHAGRTADTPEVRLDEELDALRLYARVQELRFGDRLSVAWDVDPALLGAAIPPFVLQPLLENAIKYSVEALGGAHRVIVSARRGAAMDSAPALCVCVGDDGIGPEAAARRRARLGGHGLGLANVRDRLRALYGDSASLALRPAPTGRGTDAELTLPLRIAHDRSRPDGDAPQPGARDASRGQSR